MMPCVPLNYDSFFYQTPIKSFIFARTIYYALMNLYVVLLA